MKARAVDWLLFTFVTFEFISGLGSFLVGRPEGRLIFWIHTLVGLSTVLLLLWKFRRVHKRVIESRRWQLSTAVSVLTALAMLLTIGSGIIWAIWQRPLGYPNGMILHTTSAIGLLILMVWHQILRFKPLRTRDLAGRRTALNFLGLFAFGGLIWGAQETTNTRLQTEGAERRFTGSRKAGEGSGNSSFPVTMWMFDNPAPVDIDSYRLLIAASTSLDSEMNQRSATSHPIATLPMTDLASLPQTSIEATIDCTGGWYSTQIWSGIRVEDLMRNHEIADDVQWVAFHSITGYRWSLPAAEGMDALLATHVGDEPLSHGHGAPLRLVAPGRRGFQWVKWVNEIRLLDERDLGQWGRIFISGL